MKNSTYKKILITGGAGYLGSILGGRLLDNGFEVTVIDNLLYKQRPLFHLCANPNFNFVFGDVRDKSVMRKLIKEADVIIPLAAIVGAPACDLEPNLATSVNFDAIKLLNSLRSKNQLIVYPTTNSGYGIQTGDVFCTEETPLTPISLYGKTKSEAEKLLLMSKNTITLRLATVFGASPRMRIDLLVNHFVLTALKDSYLVIFEKDFKRNFVHIQDAADCFLFCINNSKKMVGKPYNVGLDSANLSKEQLALKIKEYIPSFYIHFSDVGTDPDKRNYIVSNERLRKTGFEARHTLDEGIKELIKCYEMLRREDFKNV